MKKKLTSMIALLLVAVMVFPMGVFADDPVQTPELKIYNGETEAADIILYSGSSTESSKQLSITTGYTGNVTWYSSDDRIVSVNNGLITAVGTETTTPVTITVRDTNDDSKFAKCNVTVVPRKWDKVTITAQPTTTSYISGQSFSTSGMKVTAEYNDAATAVEISNYEIFVIKNGTAVENCALDTTCTAIRLKLDGRFVPGDIAITVQELTVTNVSIYDSVVEAKEDDVLAPTVNVTYNDGTAVPITGGFEIYMKKTTDDASAYTKYTGTKLAVGTYNFKVKYRNVESNVGTLTVKAKTVTPTVDVFTAEIKSGTPTKTTYNVGEKFDPAGLQIYLYKNGDLIGTPSAANINVLAAFAEADVGTNVAKEISFKYTYSGFQYKDVTFKISVSGLTIVAPSTKDTRTPRSIYSMVTLREKYSVGETIDATDIDYLRVYFTDAPNTRVTIYSSDFANFEAAVDLEVLTADGERKSSIGTRRHTIQSTDITADGYVNLRCYFGEVTKDFIVPVGDPDVSLIYKDNLIKEYSKLQDALDATIAQDEEVSVEVFNVENLTVYDEITIKLGTDQAFNNYYDFIPQSTIFIDLNGHKFSFKTTQIEINSSYVQFVITNTNAEAAGEVVYLDKDGATLKLAKGETLVFKKNGDVPGFYAVTVGTVTNGKITADATITNKVIEAPHGSTVKFTITPDTGYEIESVKVDNKSVTTDTKNYSVNSSGVATYTMADITANKAIAVTFKKSNSIENWKNPFYDVSSSAKYYSAIKFVYENQLFNGYNETVNGTMRTLFKPNTTMTRAMFVTVLGRLAGVDGSKYKDKYSFIDIPTDGSAAWYAPYVEWAVQYGITNGLGNGKFGPDVEITHQEMYVFMQRYALVIQHIPFDSTNVNITVSDKAEVADWAVEAVKFATACDFLITTSTNRITPDGDALRSELAMLLEKFCVNVLGWSEE